MSEATKSPDDSSSNHDETWFRQRLEARRAELIAISAQEDRSTIELDQTRVGRLSRMDAMQGHEMHLESKRRVKIDLARIASALQRLDDGEFGECLDCGENIAPGRLEIDPAAALCVACAEVRENR
ncbi:MAG: molecular chaperone DnaK [marine bacterium B5-7]|nr:MAG: molecular chaperone DnaK [marine bacterium B5-7]